MTSPDPGISVIIPTFERPGFVGDAIRSVLDQQVEPLEVIVVDAGAGGETQRVVQAFGPPVRYLPHAGPTPAATRNHGLSRARGEFIAFLDDDDLWSPAALSRQREFLLGNPDTDLVLGLTQRMVRRESGDGEPVFIPYRDPVRLHSLGCGLFRRGLFERVGLLDESMRHAEDDDWFMRAKAEGVSMHFLSEVTLYYRFHGGNMTANREARKPDMLRLVKNRLDRIRRDRDDP